MELTALNSLEVFAAGSANATEPTYHISYEDEYYNSGKKIPGSTAGSITGATDKTILAAPEADFVSRRVKSLVIYNADDTSSTVTLQRDVDGTEIPIIKAVLASGYSLVYDGRGFSVSPYEASASDSKATSNSVVISSNLVTSDSKAASNSVLISGNTSRATSNSVIASTNLSASTSRATSNSVIASTNLSTGDSKATSLSTIASTNLSASTSRATSNSVIASSNLATGDSKAASLSVIISTTDSTVASYHA